MTEKLDGTCCMVNDQVLYKRFDYKPGRSLPKNAISCQEGPDFIIGHFPHYVKVDHNNPSDKWHVKAKEKYDILIDCTYELIGVHFSSNPYNLDNYYIEELFFIEKMVICVKLRELILVLIEIVKN